MSDSPSPGAGYSLFDEEERVIAEAGEMVTRLEEVAGWVKALSAAYQKGYREGKRLVRLSDRVQFDMQKANRRLAEQAEELAALNLAMATEIEQRKVLEAELKRLATTDVLTGVASRRSVLELLEHEIARSRREGEPLSLLALDIDNFKKINDAYGHAAGDEALKAFVGPCRLGLRASDIFGRSGGEEFLAVLVGADLYQAVGIADRLRQSVAALRLHHGGRAFGITVSGGIAALGDGEEIDSLLARADEALYQAKRSGRNRIETAGAARPS